MLFAACCQGQPEPLRGQECTAPHSLRGRASIKRLQKLRCEQASCTIGINNGTGPGDGRVEVANVSERIGVARVEFEAQAVFEGQTTSHFPGILCISGVVITSPIVVMLHVVNSRCIGNTEQEIGKGAVRVIAAEGVGAVIVAAQESEARDGPDVTPIDSKFKGVRAFRPGEIVVERPGIRLSGRVTTISVQALKATGE